MSAVLPAALSVVNTGVSRDSDKVVANRESESGWVRDFHDRALVRPALVLFAETDRCARQRNYAPIHVHRDAHLRPVELCIGAWTGDDRHLEGIENDTGSHR